jgi:hypothetical protein
MRGKWNGKENGIEDGVNLVVSELEVTITRNVFTIQLTYFHSAK